MGFFRHPQGIGIIRAAVSVREYWLLVSIIVLGLLVRVYDVTQPAIWYDEASSVLMSEFSLPLIWFHTRYDVHPPLYYMLLHGWTSVFGNGVFALRAMSVLAGELTVVLGVWLVALIATRRAALLSGLLLALLPIGVRYSQEVRMYALQGTWLMGATIVLVYWVKDPQKYRYPILYALLMTAAFYTHYFAGLCVLSHGAYLLWLRFGSPRKCYLVTQPAWWIANAAIVVMYLPWVPHLMTQLSHLDEVGWIPSLTDFTLPSMIWQSLMLNDGVNLPWLMFAAIPLAMVWVSGWTVLRDKEPHQLNALLVIYSFAPMLIVFCMSFGDSFFVPRYLMFSVLGLPMILAIALDRLMKQYRRLALGCLVFLVSIEGVGLYHVYTQTNKMNDLSTQQNDQSDRMTDYINQHFIAGDRLVVDDMSWYLSVIYYNKTGTQPLLYTPPEPTGESGRPDNEGEGALFYQDAEKFYLDNFESLPFDTGRVWLVSGIDPDDATTVPKDWTKMAVMPFGDAQVLLFSVCLHTSDMAKPAKGRACVNQ